MFKESHSVDRPLEVEIGKDTVYVRKDIKEIEVSDDEGNTQTEYSYLEEEVPKESWELYKSIIGHDSELSEIEEAVAELAALITEGV